jgi:hypothetical protein
LVKTSPGSLWLAAQALPCHATQMSTWAIGELLLLLSILYFSYCPWSLTKLVKISEPSSQILLCDAAA